MLSAESILQLLLIAGGVLGYFRLQKEHDQKLQALEAHTKSEREKDNLENQKFARDVAAAERKENERNQRALEQLTQDNARHAEMRAVAETKADERDRQVIVLERQLGQTIDKALTEAKVATEERVKREMLEKENKELKADRELDRQRIGELEDEVKVIPSMKMEISKLQEQVAQLMEERAQKDKEIDQLKAAVNEAA